MQLKVGKIMSNSRKTKNMLLSVLPCRVEKIYNIHITLMVKAHDVKGENW